MEVTKEHPILAVQEFARAIPRGCADIRPGVFDKIVQQFFFMIAVSADSFFNRSSHK
jgi:hypothetical protein